MKKFLPLAFTLLFASALLATSRPAQSAQGDLQNRVAELEEALAAEKKASQSVRANLELIQSYIERQAASAKKLSASLDQAEKEGFAKGINFQSRVTLLSGWREALTASQKDLPRLQTLPDKGETPKVRGSRTKKR